MNVLVLPSTDDQTMIHHFRARLQLTLAALFVLMVVTTVSADGQQRPQPAKPDYSAPADAPYSRRGSGSEDAR